MKTLKRIYYTLIHLYSLIYWEECETLTFYDWIYKRRLGFSTSYAIAKLIVENGD